MAIFHSTLHRRACLAAMACALTPLSVFSQTKGKPITLIVPFPAGGPTDAVARAIGDSMSKSLGQVVIIDNKPGASSNIGSAAAARAAPDGHTLLAGAAALVTSPHLFKLNYDPLKELRAIAILAKLPVFIWVRSDSPYQTLPQLMAAIKAAPEKFNYSSSAPATTAHLGSLQLFEQLGVKPSHIGYKGSSQALTDFLGGVFPVHFEVGQPMVQHMKANKIRALAVLSNQRSALMPDVPSVAELGYAGVDAQPFTALLAPAATPSELIETLNKHAIQTVSSPDLREKLKALYMEPAKAESPQATQQWLQAESAKWGEVIRKNNLKVDT